ncbi:MAG: OmpA family protein [Actinomycetota bacterium]
MTARNGQVGTGWRGPAAVLLLIANVVLLGFNAVKQDVVTFSFGNDDEAAITRVTQTDAEDPSAEPAAPVAEPAADAALGSTPAEPEDGAQEGAENGVEADGGAAQDAAPVAEVDDWPGGRGPVPEGPPPPRLAMLGSDGEMVLSGSAPDWATVTKVIQYASEKLPGGEAAIDNQLTWHPDASRTTTWGEVTMPFAATFTASESELDPATVQGLDLAAGILTENPTIFAIVIGHADSRGDAGINAQLASDRAAAVVDYLIGQGVVPGQIVVASAGEDDPMASNDTEEGRAVNRRAEIQFKNLLTAGVGR